MCRLAFLFILNISMALLHGQEVARPALSALQAETEALRSVTEPSDEERERLQDLDALIPLIESIQKTKEHLTTLQTRGAAATIEAAKAKLANPDPLPDGPEDADDLDPDAKVERQESVAADLLAAQRRLDTLRTESQQRAERLRTLPDEIAAKRAAIESQPPPNGDVRPYARLIAEAQKELAELERQALETESTLYRDTAALNTDQLAAAEKRVAALTDLDLRWRAEVRAIRRQNANTALEDAQAQWDRLKSTPLADLAMENLQLAQERTGIDGTAARLAFWESQLKTRQAETDEIRQRFEETRQRIDLIKRAGLDLQETTGILLQSHRNRLPSTDVLHDELADAVTESASVLLRMDELRKRRALTTTRTAEPALSNATEQEQAPQRDLTTTQPDDAQASKLAEEHQALLRTSIDERSELVATLGNVSTQLQELIPLVNAFDRYINERILWIRSQQPWNPSQFLTDAASLPGFANQALRRSWSQLWNDQRSYPTAWFLYLAFVGGFIALRKRLLTHLSKLGAKAEERACHRFRITAKAFVIVMALTLGTWLIFAIPLGRAIGSGVASVLGLMLFLIFLQQSLRPKSLAVSHFHLQERIRNPLARHLRWFTPVYVGLALLVTAYRLNTAPGTSDGRLFYFVQMGVLGMGIFFMGRACLRGAANRKAWHLAVLITSIAIPVSLTLASATGFQYSVMLVEGLLAKTMWLALGLLLFASLSRRAILTARRRLKLKQASERLAAWRAERSRQQETQGTEPVLEEQPPEIEQIDLDEAQHQTHRLLRAALVLAAGIGLWGIWSSVLPAFQVFDEMTVWPGSTLADESPDLGKTNNELIPGTGTPASDAVKAPAEGISLADIALAILTFLTTYIAVRNVPGLLEVSILQRMHLDRGVAYAITSGVRYVLLITGLIIGFGFIHVSWNKVQWLAAAVSVGIGFGLQEIFANFVAGLILLVERPIRVGDIVTVGDLSGKVSQIRSRATTITLFNNRDLVVPNKAFITSEFVNWTLSDTVLRFEIPVGVAYGSSVTEVQTLLTQLAMDHPRVLKDPAPVTVFIGFGASTLDFELRAHVGQLSDLVSTQTELNQRIEAALREAGIEIAFPQMEIHVKNP